MNITVINSSIPNYDYGLNIILHSIKEILTELDNNINEVMLSSMNLPPLQTDMPSGDIATILNSIQNSDGVIFAFNTHFSAPNSIMQNLIDYLDLPMCKNILKDKNCYIVTTSKDGGEQDSINYISKIITTLGGFPSIITGINKEVVQSISVNNEHKLILEKQVEDYYRFVRQGRKFFIPNNTTNNTVQTQNNLPIETHNYNTQEPAYTTPSQEPQHIQQQVQNQPNNNGFVQGNVYQEPQKTNFTPVNKKMQNLANSYAQNNKPNSSKAINDISNLSSLVNNNQNNVQPSQGFQENNVYNQQPMGQQGFNNAPQQVNNIPQNQNNGIVNATRADDYLNQPFNNAHTDQVVPQNKTVEQMTKSLEHYYQGHLANGFNMNLFVQVTGEENFEGTLQLKGNDCTYIPGQNNIADVTITSSTKIWKDILSGRISMQKAFMTGEVKVRGNFTLLSRFDNLFKL